MKTKNTLIYILLLFCLPMLGCHQTKRDQSLVNDEPDRGTGASEVEQHDDISIGKENLLHEIENYEMLTNLYQAAKVSGLSEELEQEGPYTILAPANIAFERAKVDEKGQMPENWDKEKTKEILASHIIKGKYKAVDLLDANDLVDINGKKIQKIGKDNLLQTDIEASNGIIQIIDTLLVSGN